MKKIIIIFCIFITTVLVLKNIFVPSGVSNTTFMEKRKILSAIDSLHRKWGVTDKEIFFISDDLLAAYRIDTIEVVILELDPTEFPAENRAIADWRTFEDPAKRETVKMDRIGEYYFAKSIKKYVNPVFYFKANDVDVVYFPNPYGDLKIFMDYGHLVFNQYGGLLLDPR